MASLDAQTGSSGPVECQAHVLRRVWGKGSAIGAVLLVSVLGWLALWQMVSSHAASDGGYSALGPGMAFFDDLLLMFGNVGLPDQGFWGDICRALATGGGTQPGTWAFDQYGIALIMWMIMAVAMMLPTAIPVIAAFDDIRGAAREKGLDAVPGWVFPTGYLLVWAVLALSAAALQWVLVGLMGQEPVFASTAPVIGGSMLVMAGLYQWSALKAACLSQCRSPMRFFMSHWQDGHVGAFRMGVHHGVYCVGCCWAMMALMFVGGVMNLVWMAVLTVIMLLEKVLPQTGSVASMNRGSIFTNVTGFVFVIWGAGLFLSGLVQIGLF